MIISRTPYRVSLFGGGTDYPEWFNEHGGSVISFTINRYCSITFRALPPFFDYKYKICWSKIEEVNKIEDIQHPVVKAAVQYFEIQNGVEVIHIGDLPARSGMGSSSSFTVGLVNAIYKFVGDYEMSKHLLAKEAIYIERELLNENVGIQDQIAAAFGGLNYISFDKEGFDVEPIHPSLTRVKELSNHMMLFFTGINRHASKIVSSYSSEAFNDGMKKLSDYTQGALSAIKRGDFITVGELLDLGWKVKKSLSPNATNDKIESIFERAKNAGSIGGKLLGAGGGGFLLLCCKPEDRINLLKAFPDLIHVPFQIEFKGSQIIFDSKGYF